MWKWNLSVTQENVMECNDGSESKENVKSKKSNAKNMRNAVK
jgi:hypothetical protein